VVLPVENRRYIWRARIEYNPAQSPFVAYSRWFTISGNSLYEADLFSTSQAPPPPCVVPDEEAYIEDVLLDINGKPVLTYLDPNQLSAVTGYNIYRSSDAGLAPELWTVQGSNVIDMDEGTPNNQYVDQTGDMGGIWFYQVTAYNGACGVEGPR
jgi:hypothetical protein